MLGRMLHAVLALAALPILVVLFSAMLLFYSLVYIFEGGDA